ncbi:unnamed protein product [Bursaphelenchus xylophilus]|uniref:(pine wood nematode) hypothetical protein n=1 Tax=Bursaphelenchus xylophilus TaxID=6326 RepID=A0A1I7SI77_BURXY|nr:unnamed protein product [Bursaphelenchus xylophilus]CAD5216858.1 unnamed protein product [Bursaphelenchus xylophilus]CAG9100216.1 unnamed protein product [Bursaphelenchus xylophilus]CAG9100218.1 unnamed protein product [Bursaphelenchus xylophilus]
MSLLPYVYDPFAISPFYGRRYNPFHEVDQLVNSVLDSVQPFIDQSGQLINTNVAGSSISYNDQGDLKFECDTAGFKPEELNVDVHGHNLTIQGVHKEEKDGEKVERQFQRVVRLPKHVKMEEIKCELDEQGKLSVNVPKVAAIEEKKSTNIPIQMKKQEAVEDGKAK